MSIEEKPSGSQPAPAEEYISIAETARRIGLSAKRVRNLMHDGVFRCNEHFYRPRGIAPRFKWSRVVAWIEGKEEASDTADGAGS